MCVVATLTCCGLLKAGTAEEVAAVSAALVKNSVDLKPNPADPQSQRRGEMMRALSFQLTAAWSSGNFQRLDQTLDQVVQFSGDAALLKSATALKAELSTSRNSEINKYVAAVEEFLSRAGASCLRAKVTQEIDPLLTEAAKLSERAPPGIESTGSFRAAEKLRSGSHFLRQWQDHLARLQSGDVRGAQSALRQLTDDPNLVAILPRSELLSRVDSLNPDRPTGVEKQNAPREIVINLEKLEDVPLAYERLQTLARTGTIQGEDQPLLHVLQMLSAIRNELTAGNVSAALNYLAASSHASAELTGKNATAIAHIQREIYIKALPLSLDLPLARGLLADETPVAYLSRIMDEARDKGDWALYRKVLDVYALVNSGANPSWIDTERRAFEAFIVARNQEEAGELDAALGSYQAALRFPSLKLPVPEMAEHIKSLKEALEDRRKKLQASQTAGSTGAHSGAIGNKN